MDHVERDEALRKAQARYQLLSGIASHLLVADDPHEIIRTVYAKLSSHLGLEVYFHYLVSPTGTHLELDSYAGIPARLACDITHLAFGQAICGSVAQQGTQMIREHIQQCDDPKAELVRTLGIQAYACQPLLARGKLMGTLSFGTRQRANFAPDELELMQTIANQIAIAIERKQTEDALKASLHEKDVLLKETHHRIKNNLQVVSSLLHLQAESLPNSQVQAALQESQQRITSIALVHELLHRSHGLDQVDLRDYLLALTTDLCQAYGSDGRGIRVTLKADALRLSLEQAVPCGLIIQELLSNSIKHAFPAGRTGSIRLMLRRTASDQVALRIRDTGIGVPEHLNVGQSESLGLQLVGLLTEQLGGTITLKRRRGTTFTLAFPVGPSQDNGDA